MQRGQRAAGVCGTCRSAHERKQWTQKRWPHEVRHGWLGTSRQMAQWSSSSSVRWAATARPAAAGWRPRRPDQRRSRAAVATTPSAAAPFVYKPVAPGKILEKLSDEERETFCSSFGDFVTAFALSPKTAAKALEKKDMVEEQVLLRAVRYCVCEEVRNRWSDRNKPVYDAVRRALQEIDRSSMRFAARERSYPPAD